MFYSKFIEELNLNQFKFYDNSIFVSEYLHVIMLIKDNVLYLRDNEIFGNIKDKIEKYYDLFPCCDFKEIKFISQGDFLDLLNSLHLK